MPVVRTEGGEDYTGATVIEPEKGYVCPTGWITTPLLCGYYRFSIVLSCL